MTGKQSKELKKEQNVLPEYVLPQNILNIGERVVEDKNIYIEQSVYKKIHKFTKDKIKNESGGILVGNVIEEFGKKNIIIRGFIEAKHSEGTPTTLTFTHETWDYIHKEAQKKYPKYKILGWIHTHPDFGIFLSDYDKFIQNNFFKEEDQIAYVIDPVQKIEGFYFWINGNIERCKGFFIYDQLGVEINIEEGKTSIADNNKNEKVLNSGTSAGMKVVVGILSFLVVCLLFLSFTLFSQVKILTTQVNSLTTELYNIETSIGLITNEVESSDLNDNNAEEIQTESDQNSEQ